MCHHRCWISCCNYHRTCKCITLLQISSIMVSTCRGCSHRSHRCIHRRGLTLPAGRSTAAPRSQRYRNWWPTGQDIVLQALCGAALPRGLKRRRRTQSRWWGSAAERRAAPAPPNSPSSSATAETLILVRRMWGVLERGRRPYSTGQPAQLCKEKLRGARPVARYSAPPALEFKTLLAVSFQIYINYITANIVPGASSYLHSSLSAKPTWQPNATMFWHYALHKYPKSLKTAAGLLWVTH